ncbi:MAG: ATP-dependent DNA helicase RecG, partial [Chlorobi bacterium]|nr:ATP-dependent DNA helicase RecG [Chlorobiota bacterium]
MSEQNPLYNSIQYLKSVGPKRAEAFRKVGIARIKDVLYFFPSSYLDRSSILSSAQVYKYVIQGFEGEVTLLGKVFETEEIHYGKKSIFKVTFRDESGFFECVWFHGIKFFRDRFKEDDFYALSAKPTITKYGHLQFVHPDFDKLSENEPEEFVNTGKIISFYRLPKTLRNTLIGDFQIRKIINAAVTEYAGYLTETLPELLLKENRLCNIREAITNIHFPENPDKLKAAKERFKYEELFYIESLVALKHYNYKNKISGIKFNVNAKPLKKFLDSLPFELTDAQLKVLSEIRKDMESPEPMNRLLQGDVGSGKTIVALIAMIIAATDGYQAVLMAPTEILANQHYKKVAELVKILKLRVGLLIGGMKAKEKRELLYDLAAGEIDLVIGTHALFEDPVVFKNLGFIVIDEQHRFGVIQKSRLIQKGIAPDTLVMTATPIPRALTLTVYGDLDVSVIDEMPKNRKPIKTALRKEKSLSDIYNFISDMNRDEGYQAYIVYPLVEESEKIELKAAETYYKSLKEEYFSHLNVGLIHGRMRWQEKDQIMIDFAQKKIDVLISTTVIEVGVDVPDANIILINDAERFGLSQLHQLRGRVGRSDKQAYCILVTGIEKPINVEKISYDFKYLSRRQIEKNKTVIRLSAMVNFSDGFKLSEIDLKLRGPGDIFGTKQSGFPELKYADIIEDKNLLIKAKED